MDIRAWSEDNRIIAVVKGIGTEFAFYLYKNDEIVEKSVYSSSAAFGFHLRGPGAYQIKVFARAPGEDKSRGWSNKIVIDEVRRSPIKNATSVSNEAQGAETSGAGTNGTGSAPQLQLQSELDLSLFELEPEEQDSLRNLFGLTSRGHDVVAWIQALRDQPTPSVAGWFNSGKVKGESEQILREGWRFPKQDAIVFDEIIDWSTPGRANRTWGFELHPWRFIDPVLDDYFKNGSEDLLRWMLNVALDWWDFAETTEDHDSMAWYDMAISLRMPRLARLIIATAKSGLRHRTIDLITPALHHIDRAKDPEVFHPQNNHGFYSAAAALDFAKWLPSLPSIEELEHVGEERMGIMARQQFAPDGGHLEHSPDYHRMLLGSFEWAIRDNLINDREVVERIEKAVEVLGWMVQPDGNLVQFGDSPSFEMGGPGRKSSNPRTAFILTDGRRGEPNEQEMQVLPDSGYAFVRSPQPSQQGENLKSSYLAFQAGFHSRAHKHADDLTFTWFDHGREILTDSGRFGYGDLLSPDSPDRLKGFYYSRPERQYVESTRAHNTVEVNGRDIERRTRQPYGSALGRCTQVDGTFILRGEVDHGTYLHQRMLRLDPGVSLEVIDTLIPGGSPVEAIAWFNLDGSIRLDVDNDTIFAELSGNSPKLIITGQGSLIPPVRGGDDPIRGWRSRVDNELEPAWSFGYRVQVEKRTRIITEFQFKPTS